jgi:hypothetical protein
VIGNNGTARDEEAATVTVGQVFGEPYRDRF